MTSSYEGRYGEVLIENGMMTLRMQCLRAVSEVL